MLRLSHCVYLDLVSAPSKVPDLLSRSNISVVVTITLITIIFAAWIKPENGTSPKFTEYKILGGGFLKIDFFEPGSHGFKIFKYFDATCYNEENLRSAKEITSQYKSASAFYKSITAETRIYLELQGKFNMELTLDAKTKHFSKGTTDIRGMSIDISTIARSTFLDDRCFK